jgi:NAD(P)-dependent dehydrogenase (short-subunit alcohol dehydrogenase family)
MPELKGRWALILGASSGFGEACSLELARRGMNVFGVHLDRKATLPNVDRIVDAIRKSGSQAEFFNGNAADEAKRAEVLDAVAKTLAGGTVHVVLHSLAFGALKPYVAEDAREQITKPQVEMTLDVMAHSLVYWVQDLWSRKLLAKGSRVFSMTSSGSARVWATYGAVSAAKAALESHTRQLAFELAPHGIMVNCLRAGVTDTPSLRKIPGHENMMKMALERTPGGRLTTPEDVARVLAALSAPGLEWMTGNVIGVDGGEMIV